MFSVLQFCVFCSTLFPCLAASTHPLGFLKKSPKSFTIRSSAKSPSNSFRIRSSKTLDLKSFRICSYKKTYTYSLFARLDSIFFPRYFITSLLMSICLAYVTNRYNSFMPDRLPWIAQAPASLRLLELAEKVAVAPTTLLITGESGSGKDHVARLIHELGPRRDAPYLKIDCAALPPDLVESELFGHERGSFTGAVDRKLGRLELGGTGTIVLDEVAALSPTAQTKLLRVLQERTFERLGGTETLRIEARLIALTNVDLNAAVAAGQFREDLFFRLSVLPLGVPPLRDRREDILPLADYLLASLGAIHNRPNWKLTEAARRMLAAYSWPGNIRELRNALERAIVFGKGPELTPSDFSENIRAAAGGTAILSGLRSLEQIERDVIAETLEATRYHISKSAEILGISRKTLLEKRKKYGLQ